MISKLLDMLFGPTPNDAAARDTEFFKRQFVNGSPTERIVRDVSRQMELSKRFVYTQYSFDEMVEHAYRFWCLEESYFQAYIMTKSAGYYPLTLRFVLLYDHTTQAITMTNKPNNYVEKRDGPFEEIIVTGSIAGDRVIRDELERMWNELYSQVSKKFWRRNID